MNPIRVLIVDDSAVMRKTVERCLLQAGMYPSTSSAIVITLRSNVLKSVTARCFWRVQKMLTCRARYSSTIIGTLYPCFRLTIPCARAAVETETVAFGARDRRRTRSFNISGTARS